MTDPALAAALLNGDQVLGLFRAAADHLQQSAAAVDAINVYPVPDGDTGSNMAATLREAAAAAEALAPPQALPDVLAAVARGALYGARGNGGVILSQALRGFAVGAGEVEQLDAAGLASALRAAAESAYAAVMEPAEGTMLTVLRAAAGGAEAAAIALPKGGKGVPCLRVLEAAVHTAEAAEARTPDQLPALAQAGVTDAGGEGVCVILRGLLAALRGTPLAAAAAPDRPLAELAGHQPDEFGFCTEFVLEAAEAPLDIEAVRTLVSEANRSVVVVGDADAVRVHAHSDAPESLIEAAGRLGRPTRVKVDDMAAQHARFESAGSGASAACGLLAFSPGPGFDAIFESLGATAAPLPDVEKPSAGTIADLASTLGCASVLILPNHPNVVMAARLAAELARCDVTVVPTSSAPQGIAAALAFDRDASAVENASRMANAADSVRTVEVTVASASRTADGIDVHAGDAIALLDGRLVASTPNLGDTLIAGLLRSEPAADALVTLYLGQLPPGVEGAALAAAVQAALPGRTHEAIEGGQRLYPLIASIES